jgi:hypothetical protein
MARRFLAPGIQLPDFRPSASELRDVHWKHTEGQEACLCATFKGVPDQAAGRDEIPPHMVGTHRRVYVRNLLAYKATWDSKRRQIRPAIWGIFIGP